MPVGPGNKVLNHLNSKARVFLYDHRTFIGRLVSYDKSMNIVLSDCTEYKKYKPAGTKEVIEAKREYGVVILRGANVQSVIVEN